MSSTGIKNTIVKLLYAAKQSLCFLPNEILLLLISYVICIFYRLLFFLKKALLELKSSKSYATSRIQLKSINSIYICHLLYMLCYASNQHICGFKLN